MHHAGEFSCSFGVFSPGPLTWCARCVSQQDVRYFMMDALSKKPAPCCGHHVDLASQVPVPARKRQVLQTTAAPSGLDLTNLAQNGLQNTVSSQVPSTCCCDRRPLAELLTQFSCTTGAG